MLAGNTLKMCVGAGFEISSTLVMGQALKRRAQAELEPGPSLGPSVKVEPVH